MFRNSIRSRQLFRLRIGVDVEGLFVRWTGRGTGGRRHDGLAAACPAF